MSRPQAAGDLVAELERLRKRIDHVTATVLDEELRTGLGLFAITWTGRPEC